jgi:hypothetical protein
MLVLAAGGALPTVGLARFRLVAVPLAPLGGAVLASLSVTAMTGIGGTLLEWYITLSAVAALVTALIWLRSPAWRPWEPTSGKHPGRPAAVIAFAASTCACAFGLTELQNPIVSYDGRAIWMLHPLWYVAGHASSVAALRNEALVFSHPQYPPLVGGAVALSWTVLGSDTVRSGVVVIALLNAFAVLAACSGVMELARRVALSGSPNENRSGRGVALGIGAVLSALLSLVAFRTASLAAVDGHADLLWAAAAVGAVTYGLVLPWTNAHLGTAILLAAVAGTAKSEGTLTAAAIILLVGIRGVLVVRSNNSRRAYIQPVAFVIGSLLVIGSWPVVVRMLRAVPNVEFSGTRNGNDGSRLADTVRSASPHLEVLLVAVAVALVGGIFLYTRRRALGVGSDLWAWAVLIVAAAIMASVYATGPGPIKAWLGSSIQRTTLFPALAAWWIVACWVVLAAGEALNLQPAARSPASLNRASAAVGGPRIEPSPSILARDR